MFYTNNEMIKMLDCTEKTMRKYRNDGYLGYSKVGDKYITRLMTYTYF